MEEQHGARLMDPLGEAGEEEDAREEATDAAVQQAFSALRHAPAATQQWAAADAPFALHHGEDGGTLLALVSNRAREVGVAALCLDSSSLRLAQFVEAARSSAPITAMLLKLHTPRAVVVLSSSGGGAQQQLPKLPKRRGGPAAAPSAGTPAALAELGGGPGDLLAQLAAHLPDGATFELPRPAFDDTRGRAALEPLSTPQSWAKLAARASTSQGLYLAFAAANALLQHAQASGERVLLAGSLHTELVGTSAHLRMDAGSMESLELLPTASGTGGGGGGLPLPVPPAQRRLPASQRGASRAQDPGDPSTAAAAAAAAATRAGGGGASNFRPQQAQRSLFGLLNRTRTSAGERLLRANLLQPLTDPKALGMRYDAVEELLGDEALRGDVVQVLCSMPKRLDKLCGSLGALPAGSGGAAAGKAAAAAAAGAGAGGGKSGKSGDPSRRITAAVNAVLLLRSALRLVPRLAECLQGCEADLLAAVRATCLEPAFADMKRRLDEVVDPEANPSTSPFINRIQQCFAVKSGTDHMLDVARAAFCRVTDKVHNLAERYRQELHAHGAASRVAQPKLQLKVSYADRSGFYLSISLAGKGDPAALLPSLDLPKHFLPLEKRSRAALLMTTHELLALNTRLKDMAHDCLVLTEQVMDGLLRHLVSNMHLLLRLVDNVALLDVLLSFAQHAALAPPGCAYARPQLLDGGRTLNLVQARHPLLERLPGCTVCANDLCMDGDWASLHVITGPNMAGKTTTLKTVGLLVVMAQAGCLVPALSMQLSPVRQLFTHMVHGDCLESNLSSFQVECTELAHILENVDGHSLALIDELGRTTSTADGAALAWAACEALIAARARTLFSTHFGDLSRLSSVYPQARAWQLQVQVQGEQLNYSWRLQPIDDASEAGWSYGLALARTLGFPARILEQAQRVVQRVRDAQADGAARGPAAAAHAHPLQAALDVAARLSCLAHLVLEQLDDDEPPPARAGGEGGAAWEEPATVGAAPLSEQESEELLARMAELQRLAAQVLQLGSD